MNTPSTPIGISRAYPGLRRSDGFTLVELLVAIAIVSLLISILLPALKQARNTAQMAACGSNLRQVGVAMAVYAVDFDEKAPRALNNQLNGQAYSWQGVLGHLYMQGATADRRNFLHASRCPSGRQRSWSYAYNNYVETKPWKYGWQTVERPSDMIVSMDGGWQLNTSTNSINDHPKFSVNRWRDFYRYRHMPSGADPLEKFGLANGVFADGHVMTMKPNEVITTAHEDCRAMNPWKPDDYVFGSPASGGKTTY